MLYVLLPIACAAGGTEPLRPVFSEADRTHLIAALAHLNMTTNDLRFEKDVAEPRFALARTRRILTDPLELPALADEILAAAGDKAPDYWRLFAGLLEAGAGPDAREASPAAPAGGPAWPASPDPRLVEALRRFYAAAQRADGLLARAFGALRPEERAHAAASVLASSFAVEDYPARRAALVREGIPDTAIQRVLDEDLDIDPGPAADISIAIIERTDVGALLDAGRAIAEAADALCREATALSAWPERPVTVPTPLGTISVGSEQADTHADAALLILDPGGADRYEGLAGTANGLQGRPLGVVVDLAGNDVYESERLLGAGAALFGAAFVLDAAGDDVYRAAYCGQAAGLFGVGGLEDRAGDDIYRAHGFAQGAGTVGAGLLHDRDGRDLYDVGFYGQAFAGVRGAGLLIDRRGNDRYNAGGRLPDHERFDARYLSLSQGFAIGMRPFAGGGIAALVDLAGNDTYQADVYGQGASYWYAAGLLLDAAGNDTYHMFQYGQGSGIHLSAGLLADGDGDDVYSGFALLQGDAHDYAVGMLFDHAGNDTYAAHEAAAGCALNNAFALLLDSAGNDAYLSRQTTSCQGIGRESPYREYGGLAMLLDIAGTDTYACGAPDGARILRPDFGIIYDVEGPAQSRTK
ncbi:MAG: hypothetical protein JXR37_16380 [Kiritimatiellae bacterium]|nr:hypothetical protein [Kiritimatiellia bacterium]